MIKISMHICTKKRSPPKGRDLIVKSRSLVAIDDRRGNSAHGFSLVGRHLIARGADSVAVAAGQSDHFFRTGGLGSGLAVGFGVSHEIIS